MGLPEFWDLLNESLSSTSVLAKLTEFVKPKTTSRPVDASKTFEELREFETHALPHTLFQRDELLEDLPISSLRVLLLPFLKAQCLESVSDMKKRHGALLTAKFNYSLFVHETCWYARERKEFITAQEEFESFASLNYEKLDSSNLSAESRRATIIARRSTLRDLETQLSEHLSEAYRDEDSAEVFEFWVKCLYCAVLESTTSIDLINQELPLISRFTNPDYDVAKEEAEKGLCRLDGHGQILSKPFIMKISNSAELRKFYASQVLKPGHILPTITIAEAGLHDMRVEVEGLQAAQKKTVKEFGDSDSEETDQAQEAKELKARKWDDWKDAHPKGSGNTMTNRG